jgi:hypothetical protein
VTPIVRVSRDAEAFADAAAAVFIESSIALASLR